MSSGIDMYTFTYDLKRISLKSVSKRVLNY